MSQFKNQTFTPIYHSLLSYPNLTDADKITISVILSWTENERECFMGNDYLGEFMGITRTAASKRITRLKNLGIIDVRYTYKKGKREVDKRFITINDQFLEILGVSPERIGVSPERIGVSPQRRGVSPERIGVSPERRGVSSEVGGIIKDIKKDIRKDIRKEIKKEDYLEHQNTGENEFSFQKHQFHVQTMLVECFPRARNQNQIFEAIQNENDYSLKLLAGKELSSDQIRWVNEYREIIRNPNFERSE